MAEFTHLHLHTQYSLLDGAIRVKDLFPRVHELGMDTVAVTDHGNMFGAVDLYTAAKKHGVKLIFGCETYVAATDRTDRTNRRNFHLILLAKNQVGYKNLSYLNSMGYLEGFYYNPRIDKDLLREHSEGLIGMSACLGGEVAQTLLKNSVSEAEKVALEYKSLFADGDFYLEMMPNGLPEQDQLNDEYKRMGPKLGIPLVATNDCHYVHRTDAKAHEVLMAIQSGKTIADEKRLRHDHRRLLHQERRRDGRGLRRRAPRRSRTRSTSPAAATSSSTSATRACPTSRCPRARTPTATWRSGSRRG